MLLKTKNIYQVLLFIIVFVQLIDTVKAGKKKVILTPEQQAIKNKLKEERKKKSEEADKQIFHITENDFNTKVLTDKTNLWIIFYGSKNCPFTQKFNPKWLEIQQKFDKKEIKGLENNVKIAKIECYGQFLKFCVKQNNEFWPELMLYYNGTKKTIYDGDDEIEDVIKFMVEQKKKIVTESERVYDGKAPPPTQKVKNTKDLPTKNVPTKQPPTKQPPAKQPPTKQPPAKQPPKLKAPKIPPVKVDEQGIIINDGKTGEDIVKGKNDESDNKKNKQTDDDMKIYMGDDDDNKLNENENKEKQDEDKQPNIVDSNGNNDYNGYYENEVPVLATKSGSKVLPISIGGFLIGSIAIICYRTKKHRVNDTYSHRNGYSRPSHMNYNLV